MFEEQFCYMVVIDCSPLIVAIYTGKMNGFYSVQLLMITTSAVVF